MSHFTRYIFALNLNIRKSLCGLCFLGSRPEKQRPQELL